MDRSTICIILFGVLMYLSVQRSHSELIVFPRDTEILVNHSTYFNCSTSMRSEQIHWYHYRVGENKTNYVYYKGQFNQIYSNRYSIAVDTETGEYNLIIRSVQPGDGGRYACQDDGGLGSLSSAELIVLDSGSVCQSSMKPEGLVGPNSCGLPIDELQLSCSVSYSGSIPPTLQWKMEGDDTPILKGITIDYAVKRVTMNLTMSSGVEMDRASFTCTTTRAHDKQHGCTSGQVKVNYAVDQPTILNITKGDTITCSANASVPCIYRWFYGNDTLCPASCNEVITTNHLEDYSCEASCTINGISCTFVAMRIYVFENETTLVGCPLRSDDQICKPYRDAIICIFVIILIVGTICLLWYLRVYRPKKLKQKEKNVGIYKEDNRPTIPTASSQEATEQQLLISKTDDRATKLKDLEQVNEEQVIKINDLKNELIRERNEAVEQKQKLLDEIKTLQEKNEASDNEISQLKARVKDLEQSLYPVENIDYAEKPTLDRTVVTDAARRQHKPINGMTILRRELFVSHDNNSAIEVFESDDSKAFQFVGFWDIEGKPHPMDIASCTIANCLYIVVREDSESESQIMKLEPRGKLIKKWPTGGDSCRLSTYESNVIVCLFEKHLINEYSEDGNLIHTVRLSPAAGFNHAWHAIKVTSSHFVVCHGDAKDELHRVCIVDVQGKIIKELGQGKKLNVPICIVEDSERSILIADRDNQSIRLRNCLLNHQRTLIRKETGLEGYPVRICLDETKGQLFVAVNTLRSNRKEWKDGKILIFKITNR